MEVSVSKNTKIPKGKKDKKNKLKLPEWVHAIKIRFYKDVYPDKGDTVMAKIKTMDKGIGYYMEMTEYENKEALIVYKEMNRSQSIRVIRNTMQVGTLYPLYVIDKSVRKIKNTSENSESQFIDESDDELDDELEKDVDLDNFNIRIDLTNRQLTDVEKKEANTNYINYKVVHAVLHEFGFLLKQLTLKTQEDIDTIQALDYKKYLEDLAIRTIWKHPRNDISNILHQIRDDTSLVDKYFELEPLERDTFIQAICRKINKTKYTLDGHILVQTLDISGVAVIHNALDIFKKNNFTVKVISAPEYMIKMEMGSVKKLEEKFKETIMEVNNYIASHMGFIQIKKCEVSNNVNDLKHEINVV